MVLPCKIKRMQIPGIAMLRAVELIVRDILHVVGLTARGVATGHRTTLD